MGRRKRAITVAINNLNAKKAKKAVRDQQTNAREQSLVEDDGEIVLWDDVLVEESEEEMEDTSEDEEAVEGLGRDATVYFEYGDRVKGTGKGRI